MAAKKRAKKKTSARKRSNKSAANTSFLRKLTILLVLGIAAVSATYYFGPFKLRAQMEHVAIQALNATRSPEWMPTPVVQLLNMGFDRIPGSQGLVVEAGELGYGDSPLITGVPQTKSPIRVLHNTSYINLFSEQTLQSRCVAFKLSEQSEQQGSIPDGFFEDPRIKQLSTNDLKVGAWSLSPLAPPQALAQAFGDVGANEAHLVTNLAPMSTKFRDGPWQRLMEEITIHYPKRFGEVWICLGPVMGKESATLKSGRLIPSGFYAIVFELTDAGGLRAIAFWVPHDATDTQLENYITSISKIESYTGLQFLSEIDYHAREVLRSTVSPHRW